MLRRSIAFALAALAFGAAACGGGGDPTGTTRPEATALLDDFFRLAQSRDGKAFCADKRVYSQPMCERHWEVAGGAEAVPSQAPKVLDARTEEDLIALRVCGDDGLGKPYTADFVVENGGESSKVPLPVFWGGRTFSGSYKEGEEPAAEGSRQAQQPAGCP